VYIQLAEKLYMNASLGHSLNIFASDIFTYDTTYFENTLSLTPVSVRPSSPTWDWNCVLKKSGYFYVGATYQRPFGDIYTEHILYEANGKKEDVYTGLSGNYLTLDIRYFFHSEPVKKSRK